ncbi:hypothetical protein TrRE_jg5969, partial [Triparma retinervis]
MGARGGHFGLWGKVAGGWVRDKLLNKQSQDIDIALDKCTGVQFAEWLVQYQRLTSPPSSAPPKYHKILANPSQSKHLETATMTLLNYEVDLVNLRSETYASSSRIPTCSIGSPPADASRRDFTCNALFYNLHERSVEDFTGTGVEDLRGGVLRTPVDAKVTFKDDPLRLLRGVRFAGRLGFTLDEGAMEAGRDPEVRRGLTEKVSRERIGKEVQGFFKEGGRPAVSYRILYELGLVGLIYDVRGWGIEGSWDWVRHLEGFEGGLSGEEVRLAYLFGPLAGAGGGGEEE